jgi:hypothetical protein
VDVDTDNLRLTFDLKHGTLRSVQLAEDERENKAFVWENRRPLLFGAVIEAPGWDGLSDLGPGKRIKGRYVPGRFEAREKPGRVEFVGDGALEFPRGDSIRFRLCMEMAEGSRFIRTRLALSAKGRFKDRYIREIGLALPLALNVRKRVVQAGDQGLLWDTRHRYQFHTRLWWFLSQPEHNWWRHFYADQRSDHDYLLWRGEDTETAPLEVFRGRELPGWMTMYDEGGGVLFGYRGLAARAPKCLYANASGGGEAVVYLHAPTHAAISPKDPRAKQSLFSGEHEIGWLFFGSGQASERPEQEAARVWGFPDLAAPVEPRARDWAGEETEEWRAPAAAAGEMPYVFGGLPLPRGAVTSPEQARLFVRGVETAAQTRPLAFWPDGSIKWVDLVFPLRPGKVDRVTGRGAGDEAHFEVSLRRGASTPCVLRFGKKVSAGTREGIRVERSGEAISLDTGALKLRLSRGERWLESAVLGGAEMVRNDGRAQAYVDFLRPKEYVAGTTHPHGKLDPGPVRIDKIELEEAGPLRAVVRLEGYARATEPARVILRLEVFAGRSFVRLFHTVEFLHKDPRTAFVRRMGIRLPLALSKAGRRMTAGGQRGPVSATGLTRLELRQTSHASYEARVVRAKSALPETIDGGLRSHGWLDLAASRGGVAVMHRDMWQEFPKALSTDVADPAVSLEFWPASAPLMDVRRYSNYPHRAQGETAPEDPFWVRDVYYKNDPFVGISKTHEAMLFFHGPETTPERVDSVAADLNDRPLVYAGWEGYARTKVVLPQTAPDDPGHARSVANMRHVADWWLFHQKIWGWYGMWNHGDVQHRFRHGYGWILSPDSLEKMLKLPVSERGPLDVRLPPWESRQDYFTPHDWAFDNGRWGWSNTEGLLNLFMSNEYLRTGRRDLFFFMEALARHSRDVDARHDGKYFGKGTRHGVQHWSCGDHEERQTTFTEQRYYYLLTGDRRTFEWNERLTRDWYLKEPCSYAASHAGRSYGLFCRWEWTGDPELGDILRRYLHAFAQPDEISINPLVEFPSAKVVEAVTRKSDDRVLRPKGVFSSFFHNFGGMHALLEYFELTGDAKVKRAIIGTARRHLDEPEHLRYPCRKAIAFAARYAGDPRPFRRALIEWATGVGWRTACQQVTANPAHWTGPTSFLFGKHMGDKFWWADAHYVMGALDVTPPLPPELEAERLFLENRPPEPPSRAPRGSWQSEYDRPEFAEYIREPFNRST